MPSPKKAKLTTSQLITPRPNVDEHGNWKEASRNSSAERPDWVIELNPVMQGTLAAWQVYPNGRTQSAAHRSGKRRISSYEGAKVNRRFPVSGRLGHGELEAQLGIDWKAKAVDEVVQGQTKGKSSFSLSSE
jgi:hypothetical protein